MLVYEKRKVREGEREREGRNDAQDYDIYRYQEDIWLSNLDWSSKKYRSKRKTKKEMTALMEKVRSSSINQVIATRNKMEEEDEGEGETLLINDPNAVRRATHKPGYPE